MKKFYLRANAKTALSNEGNEAQERHLNAVFATGDTASEPSLSLEKRVTELAAQSVKRAVRLNQRRTVVRRGFSLAGAMALIVIGMKVWPVVTLELLLRRAEAASSAAHSAHIVVWRVADDGSRIKESESWQQNGLWREARTAMGRSNISLFDGTSQWNYQPAFNKVTVYRKDGPYGKGKPEPSEITGTALLREFTGSRFSKKLPRVTALDTTDNGRAVRQVRIQTVSPNDLESKDITLLVERATDLPIRAEMNVSAYSGQHTRMFAEFSFNEALPAQLFKPDFPPSARLVDHDKGKEEWRQRLARGIARKEVGGRTIAIRDLQVNAEGDVFLFYTAGKRPGDAFRVDNRYAGRDWNIEISDEFGTNYVLDQGSFVSAVKDQNSDIPKGYSFNGERPEGDMWIPLNPQSPWKPRRFTITFHINSTNLHGKLEDPEREANYSKTAIFILPVQQPATALVPDYMLYVSPSFDESSVLRLRADARGLLPPGVEPSPQLVRTLTGSEGIGLTFSPDGKKLASGARLWDAGTGQLLQKGTQSGIFSPDWKTLAITSGLAQNPDGSTSEVQLWDAQKNKETLKFPIGVWGLRRLSFSRDGKTLAGVGTLIKKRNGNIVSDMDVWTRLWDARTGRVLQTRRLPHHGFIVSAVVLAPNTVSDSWLVVTSQQKAEGDLAVGGVVRLWDGRTGALLHTLDTDDFITGQVVLSADGKTLAVAGRQASDGTRSTIHEVRICDAATGTWQRSLHDESYGTMEMAFSPDSNLLAWGDSRDKTVKLWDAHSGRLLQSLVGHGREVNSLTFSPDSKMLASGDNGGNIILWRVT